MEGTETITPEDFSEFVETEDENIVLGVNIGMEIETQSRSFYQSVALKMPSDRRIVLKLLANEELKHPKMLMAFKMAIQRSGHWIELDEKRLKQIARPRLFVGKGSAPAIDENDTDVEIILAALRAEQRTADFYEEVGVKVKEQKAKMFFNLLRKFEMGHYSLLEGILQASST